MTSGLLFDRQLPFGERDNYLNFGSQRMFASAGSSDRDDYSTLSQEKEELDRYLASSIRALSVKDRTAALEEVHGVAPSSAEQEDAAMLDQRLEEIESHLTKMNTTGSAYDIALNENSYYVQDRNLRLMFLRSNRYDSKPAAEQIVNFFELKNTLFGAEKLTKDILFQDLSVDDKKSLEEGSVQLLPDKDSINRTILLFLPGLRSQVPAESEARARFYLMMKTIQNSEDVQKKGIIAVVYGMDEYQDKKNGAGAHLFARVATSLPVTWGGIHFCQNDFKGYVIMRDIIMRLPKYLLPKFRVHSGSHVEVRYALRGFGIPDGSLPISSLNSSPLLQNHKLWLLQAACEDNSGFHPTFLTTQLSRPNSPNQSLATSSPAALMVGRLGESSNSQEPRVTPLATDVLLGHGFKLNPGNLKLHDMIGDIVDDYDSAPKKGDKMSISCKIVDDCKASGSRFLSFDGKTRTWSIVTDKVARNKVAKAIRNRRRSVEGKLMLSRK